MITPDASAALPFTQAELPEWCSDPVLVQAPLEEVSRGSARDSAVQMPEQAMDARLRSSAEQAVPTCAEYSAAHWPATVPPDTLRQRSSEATSNADANEQAAVRRQHASATHEAACQRDQAASHASQASHQQAPADDGDGPVILQGADVAKSTEAASLRRNLGQAFVIGHEPPAGEHEHGNACCILAKACHGFHFAASASEAQRWHYLCCSFLIGEGSPFLCQTQCIAYKRRSGSNPAGSPYADA